MAAGAERSLPVEVFGDAKLTGLILRVVASWSSLWLWGLALWFFLISVGSHWSCIHKGRGISFSMTYFSYIFPQTALLTATFAVGETFRCRAIQIIGCVMTPILIVAWFLVFAAMVRAILNKQILWPQKGEDKDEGGFKGPRSRRDTV